MKNGAVILVILVILSFIVVAVFGLGHMSGMTANENGNMTGCIFTGKIMLCKMSVVEHISLWQSTFTAIPQESLILLVLLVLSIAVIFAAKNILVSPRLSPNAALIKELYELYLREHPDLLLFNSLKEAFSQGVLNPKIY